MIVLNCDHGANDCEQHLVPYSVVACPVGWLKQFNTRLVCAACHAHRRLEDRSCRACRTPWPDLFACDICPRHYLKCQFGSRGAWSGLVCPACSYAPESGASRVFEKCKHCSKDYESSYSWCPFCGCPS